jgi:putative serine protease PepD
MKMVMEDHTTLTPDAPTLEERPPVAPVKRAMWRTAVIALVAGVLGGSLGAYAIGAIEDRGVTVERVATPRIPGTDLSGVATVAQKLNPSIVRIDTTQAGPFGQVGQGTGSGVIFSSDGYILTNNHVIAGATGIEVTLSTGETMTATLVGTAAPSDDIAVVKVTKTGLPAATFGSISDLTVGDLAVAIGSPFGLQGSVTAGVISALHRNIDLGTESLTDAIQTDAPINPGNSGGALADGRGNVVGINTAILGSSGNVGVGFAIPIDIARRDARQIIETGHASRPFLGISGENLPDNGGARIIQVVPDGPAAAAGLRAGDVVVAVDGTSVASMDALIASLASHDSGDQVRLTYTRNGTRHTATATLRARTTE